MKLIVITPSALIENETTIINQLFENGLHTLHIRKPKMNTRDMRKYIEQIPVHFQKNIVIHSHHNLALSYPIRGIHLTRSHLRRNFSYRLLLRWMRIKKPALTFSTSYHKLASIYEEERKYDYVFLSPIFDSLTEKFYSGFSEHSLRIMLEKKRTLVIARGGVNSRNVEKAKQLGFQGIALNSSLWKSNDPVGEFCAVMDMFKTLELPNE